LLTIKEAQRRGARGPARQDLEPYREYITHCYLEEGLTQRMLIQLLEDEYGVKTSISTLKEWLRDWEVRKPPHQGTPTHPEDEQLKECIIYYFFNKTANDRQILRALERKGFLISNYTLRRIRMQLGLRIRARDGDKEQREFREQIRQWVTAELKTGRIDGFGKGLLHTYFRKNGYAVSRRMLFREYRFLNPEVVNARRKNFQRHRGEYIVPGPNFIWSVDGHDKLKEFGFEIYACIDAYSRMIIWIYIGVSNKTGVSILRQFTDRVQILKIHPQFIRSDRGVECAWLCQAQWELHQAYNDDIPIRDCYMYGTSTANQRIEAWWNQLGQGCGFRWKNYFRWLKESNNWQPQFISHRVALIALYMPSLREELQEFAELWNTHYIRKQKQRPNNVPGKPWENWEDPKPGVEDYGVPANAERIAQLSAIVEPYDLDGFLPVDIWNLCCDFFNDIGFDIKQRPDLEDLENRESPWFTVYIRLRDFLQAHQESGEEPALSLLPRPTARRWANEAERAAFATRASERRANDGEIEVFELPMDGEGLGRRQQWLDDYYPGGYETEEEDAQQSE
jgi:hypothetical protein